MNLVWFAMNVFTHETTVETSKSKEEVVAALKAYTDTNISISIYNPNTSSSKLYIGHVDNSSFRIKEVCMSKYDFKPIISGIVGSEDNGASVYMKIAMSKILQIVYAIAVVTIIVNSYYVISEYVQLKTIDENNVVYALLGIAFIVGGLVYDKISVKNLKRDLRKIVQGPEFREYH